MAIPTELKLIIAVSGIFFSFSYSAVKQEDLYKTSYGTDAEGNGGERFAFTFLALVVERGINALVALVGVLAFGGSGVKIPQLDIFNSGVSQMLAMASSNEALRYVSYATQVLGKSGKMVPVMVGGILLGGKRYSASEYAQVRRDATRRPTERARASDSPRARRSAGDAGDGRRARLQLWRQVEKGRLRLVLRPASHPRLARLGCDHWCVGVGTRWVTSLRQTDARGVASLWQAGCRTR